MPSDVTGTLRQPRPLLILAGSAAVVTVAPVENTVQPSELVDADTGEILEQLPRVEALARLYEAVTRHGGHTAAVWASTEAQRHRAAHGHELAHGCCADVSVRAPTDS